MWTGRVQVSGALCCGCRTELTPCCRTRGLTCSVQEAQDTTQMHNQYDCETVDQSGADPAYARHCGQRCLSRQVAGETEVKAQIKMRLSTSGVPIVVIRSFQLLQKKSALQFKAIDQVRLPASSTAPEANPAQIPAVMNPDSGRAGPTPNLCFPTDREAVQARRKDTDALKCRRLLHNCCSMNAITNFS